MQHQAIIQRRIDELREQGLFRSLKTVSGSGPLVELADRQALLLCSNNYLGLAEHPRLKQASAEAAIRYGASSGASRLVSGSMPLHEELEAEVADWKGSETALVFNSGYAANTGVIAALAGRGDVIFSDRLNHASIIDGALLSGARLVRYPHNDVLALERLMTEHVGNGLRLIVTDGVFSMDGDLAPLAQLAACARSHGALLMVDDAHGGGVLGEQGRGTADLLDVAGDVDIRMGTFGKALGSFGAYIATSRLLRDYLINRARSFVFSTSLPPAVTAASLEALRLVRSAEGERLRAELAENVTLFRGLLRGQGFAIPAAPTPIIPIQVGDPVTTMEFSRRLLERDILLQGIRPPTVPPGTSRLRCTVMALHRPEQLQRAATEIGAIGRELGVV